MRARIKKVCIIGAAVLLSGCAYAVFFIKTGVGIPCLFHLITGFKCPGCGITRMLISLLKLDLPAAFQYNAAVLCLLPFLFPLLVYWVYRYIRYGFHQNPKPIEAICWVFVAILLVWGVVRNVIGM
jgi:hypothetical protein